MEEMDIDQVKYAAKDQTWFLQQQQKQQKQSRTKVIAWGSRLSATQCSFSPVHGAGWVATHRQIQQNPWHFIMPSFGKQK